MSTQDPKLRSRWKVVASAQVSRWYAGLDDRQALSVKCAVGELAEARPVRSFAALSDELVSLAKVVEALDGHVEVRAVFDDQTSTLLREPAPPGKD